MNLFVLMQFGIVVENICKEKAGIGPGSLIYLIAYLFILIASNIPTFLKNKENPYYASIGASGAISGILFIYIVFNPFRLLLLFGMFPLPGIAMGLLYLFYSRWASTHGKDHIDHDAHYYGALLGIIAGVLIKYLI
jgi:membrane associated rhomboid family serine protease